MTSEISSLTKISSLGRYRYYTPEADTDQGLKRIVEEDMPPIRPLPKFDVLVLDEQQDMNPIIYNFVLKLLRDCAKTGVNSPQLMLLGDPRQVLSHHNQPPRAIYMEITDRYFEGNLPIQQCR